MVSARSWGLHTGVAGADARCHPSQRATTPVPPPCGGPGAPVTSPGAPPQAMPLLKRAPKEEEEEDGDPFAAHPESRYRRRATLERLVGLAPFGRARRTPAKDGDGDGGRARRRSEDFGLLRRLPGRRKASVEALAERSVPKRSSLLRLALGTRGQRGSAGERPSTAESEGVSDGEPDGGGQRPEGRGKAREPLSGERGRGDVDVGTWDMGLGDLETWGKWDGDLGTWAWGCGTCGHGDMGHVGMGTR